MGAESSTIEREYYVGQLILVPATPGGLIKHTAKILRIHDYGRYDVRFDDGFIRTVFDSDMKPLDRRRSLEDRPMPHLAGSDARTLSSTDDAKDVDMDGWHQIRDTKSTDREVCWTLTDQRMSDAEFDTWLTDSFKPSVHKSKAEGGTITVEFGFPLSSDDQSIPLTEEGEKPSKSAVTVHDLKRFQTVLDEMDEGNTLRIHDLIKETNENIEVQKHITSLICGFDRISTDKVDESMDKEYFNRITNIDFEHYDKRSDDGYSDSESERSEIPGLRTTIRFDLDFDKDYYGISGDDCKSDTLLRPDEKSESAMKFETDTIRELGRRLNIDPSLIRIEQVQRGSVILVLVIVGGAMALGLGGLKLGRLGFDLMKGRSKTTKTKKVGGEMIRNVNVGDTVIVEYNGSEYTTTVKEYCVKMNESESTITVEYPDPTPFWFTNCETLRLWDPRIQEHLPFQPGEQSSQSQFSGYIESKEGSRALALSFSWQR